MTVLEKTEFVEISWGQKEKEMYPENDTGPH
jgi:hypothetical protein